MDKLYIVDVSVLVKGLREPSLTFFSAHVPDVGTIVTVPFRNKTRPAIVVGVQSARKAKTEIRDAAFSLKKIPLTPGGYVFSAPFMRTVATLADFYATSHGEVLLSLFPNRLLPHIDDLARLPDARHTEEVETSASVDCIQSDIRTRVERYAKDASKMLARKGSVFILVPTRERARFVANELKGEIGKDTVIELSARFASKKLITLWNEVAEAKKPIVVVGTPAFLSVPLPNVQLYILEGETDSYRGLVRPFLDAKQALFTLGEETQADILVGATYVSSETSERCGSTQAIDSIPFSNELEVVDMKPEGEEKEKTSFKLLSDTLSTRLKEATERGENTFLFVARRGLFTSTVCADCGTLVECPACGAGLVLHENKNKGRVFLCHRCDFSSRADIVCAECGSWRLTPLGIGVGRVYEEIKELYPNVFVVSRDHTTAAEARKQIDELLRTPGAILVGTDMALEPLQAEKVDTVGVVSIDARFSIPSYSIEEDILRTLLTLRSVAEKHFIVQTRARENRTFDFVSGQHLNAFRKSELASRKRFGYPPFSTLISLLYRGRRTRVESMKETIERALGDQKATVTTLPFRKNPKGVFEGTTIVRIADSLHAFPLLRQALRSLPPEVEVKVNPERLW